MVCPSFWKTSQLYELCTSQHRTDRAHCEGFITGVASTLQNEQISRVRVCIPKGTSSNDVVQKVVWYLREKADADDMKVVAQLMHVLPVGWVEPIDISNAVLFLASDESRYITGLPMTVDAGSMLK